MHMKNSMFTFIALTIFLILPVFATETDRHSVMMERMFGFQYPLDSGGDYKVGWIQRWNQSEIRADFQKIRANFPKVNLLRIPIDWYEMNETLLLNHVENVIDLGKEFGFKFLFVLSTDSEATLGLLHHKTTCKPTGQITRIDCPTS